MRQSGQALPQLKAKHIVILIQKTYTCFTSFIFHSCPGLTVLHSMKFRMVGKTVV